MGRVVEICQIYVFLPAESMQPSSGSQNMRVTGQKAYTKRW
jgi:hypothetical protein